MSDLLDAARQALEALEWNYNTDLDNIPACVQWAKMLQENITALRQAIEQVEQQEPVAWKDKTYGNLHHYDYGNSIPLYTTLPQRKPLTDGEIFEVHKRVDSMQYLTFARAIERAHGIGGGK